MSSEEETKKHLLLLGALADQLRPEVVRRIELRWVERALVQWLGPAIEVDYPSIGSKLRSAELRDEVGASALLEVLEELRRASEERDAATTARELAAGRAGHTPGWSKVLATGDPIQLTLYYRMSLSEDMPRALEMPRLGATAILTLFAASFAGVPRETEMERQIEQVTAALPPASSS